MARCENCERLLASETAACPYCAVQWEQTRPLVQESENVPVFNATVNASLWSSTYFAVVAWLLALLIPGKGQFAAIFFFWAIIPIAFLMGAIISLCVLSPVAFVANKLASRAISKFLVYFMLISGIITLLYFFKILKAAQPLPIEAYGAITFLFGFIIIFWLRFSKKLEF